MQKKNNYVVEFSLMEFQWNFSRIEFFVKMFMIFFFIKMFIQLSIFFLLNVDHSIIILRQNLDKIYRDKIYRLKFYTTLLFKCKYMNIYSLYDTWIHIYSIDVDKFNDL